MPSQEFTASGPWSWPGGITQATVECLGGGGGGGTASGNPSTGGGGKGGAYARTVITKGAEASLDIVVGVQSLFGDPSSGSTVSQGGTVRCRAPGGANGATATVNSTNGAGATTYSGGEVPLGDVTFDGGNGGTGNFTAGVQGSGAGGGGAGPTGPGGNGNVNVAGAAGPGVWLDGIVHQKAGGAGVGNSTVGVLPIGQGGGAAGSGGKANTNTDRTGGNSQAGVVVVSWTTVPPPSQAFAMIL